MHGHLGETLDVLDIGVSTGVTSIALLDFLLAWGYACDLTRRPFPVKDLRFAGLDQTSTTLRKAQSVVSAYASALGRRFASRVGTPHGRAEARALERVHRWGVAMAEDASWLPCVLDRDRPTLPWSPNILVASYVLSELDQRGREQLEALIDDLPDRGLAILQEPGDEHAMSLMRW